LSPDRPFNLLSLQRNKP
jgi:2-alkenal reductase